jgi:hypothetical protein
MSDTNQNKFLINSKGSQIPTNLIPPLEVIRDEEVRTVVEIAKGLREDIRTVKQDIMERISSYIELSYDTYGITPGGKKGNMTLLSYDNRLKITIQMNESIVFNEQLQIARELLAECLREWTKDGRDELKAFVEEAFRVDKQGRINTYQVMRLLKIESTDPRFQKAQAAIRSAITTVDAKEYIRIHEKNKVGHWEHINLNFASL